MSDDFEKEHLERFYGRRLGRPLKPSQKRGLEEVLPGIQITDQILDELKDCKDLKSTLKTLNFSPTTKGLCLEIGFGGGEHLAAQAAQNPDIAFIGCEPFLNGICSLLKHCEEQSLKNIRILPDDCRPLLKALPDNCLRQVFLLFSDPWPKTRHHKRRVLNEENLDSFSRLLKKDGELRVATDDPSLIAWSFTHLEADQNFEWANPDPKDHTIRPEGWPATRYEQKAIKQGRQPKYYSYINKK